MRLQLNGEIREISQAESLSDLLGLLQLPAKSVLVEWNGHPVAPPEFATTKISDGDSIEIVRMVAGG